MATAGLHTYEDMMRALLWPNAVASTLVPHGAFPPVQHLPTVCEGEGGFSVCLDVHQFAPRELTVKTVERSIVIEGHHKERPDEHGYVQRHFVRRYLLPESYDAEHVACSISSDGVLTVMAPKISEIKEKGEKVVPITVSRAPAVKHHIPPQHIFPDVQAVVPEHSSKPASHHF